MVERSKIRVLLDARKLGDGGIGVYIQNLVSGLIALRSDRDIPLVLTLLVRPEHADDSILDGEAREFLTRIASEVTIVEESSEPYSFAEYFTLAKRHRALLREQDLFHSPHYTLPYSLRIPSIVTVHDVIHVQLPETYLHRPVARHLIRSAVSRAAHVITVSGTSLARLQKVVGGSRTPMTVIPNCVRRGVELLPPEAVTEFLRAESLPNPYYLFVGSDRPHKGYRELVTAWKRLAHYCSAENISVPSLLVVGGRFDDRARSLPAELGIENLVTLLGEVSNQSLTFLYNAARGVVVPSQIEGFGLVALEAMACGVPVICSPELSLKELCGNSAWYAESFAPEALAGALYSSFINAELSEARASDGLYRAREYTREFVTWKTFEVYESVLPEELRVSSEHHSEIISYGEKEIYDRFLRKAL